MVFFKIQFSLLLTLLFINLPSQYSAENLSYNIEILNEMPAPINVTCRSRNMTFGVQTLQSSFSYDFALRVDTYALEETYANCSFNGAGKGGLFSMFDYNRDRFNCADKLTCEWRVVTDGLYQIYGNSRHLVYKW
ncbi:hypothetical protein ABFS83_07G058400 [Erythranthe nasuta]